MHTPVPPSRLNAPSIISASCILGLLYAGRPMLQPIVLAAVLSLLVAPLVRTLSQYGIRRVPATLTALLLAGAAAAGTGAILAAQLVSVTSELPQYQAALLRKAEQLRTRAERPLAWLEAGLNHGAELAPDTGSEQPLQPAGAHQPVPVEIRPPHPSTGDTLARLFSLVWGPIGEAGLVLVLLLFILLEHESLRDRLIRLAGQTQTSRTVRALADAAHGVSRFFFSQFVVNAAFGVAIGLALWAFGVPHAILWGALSALLRFVPYLGALGSGAIITAFTAAIDPGWTLTLSCAGLFAIVELVVANLVEPKVYGHSTGISPLAVVISALFWGTLWGPVGLLISTPLTVCLVVAGRHVRALEPLSILLGEAPSVTGAQRFFQRALSGETGAILHDAAAYLRRASFARYCDHILLPGLALAVADLRTGQIDTLQQEHIRSTIADVAESLAPSTATAGRARRRRHVSLLDANVGAHLRQLREARLGRWQGSLDVPQRSIVLCAGLALERDDLVSELLARALREAGVDARSIALPLPHEEHGPDKAKLVSTVFIPYPLGDVLEAWTEAMARLRMLLPHAILVTIRAPQDEMAAPDQAVQPHVDMVLRSFEEGLAFVAPQHPASA
ncbi:AI-2E family transporter [Rugamonas apoptosis]|uniref:AI-2E family transporter n=1 Tax=Rugamonas apoptosis TaxID=2758570 RepID=A0A7W2FDY1_9BURK|nr:AI-2E family transporter [Rugamonas apoptosis]MBA5689916.1 AI-2E family transporter [Rugamonas apoptosis]